MTESSCGASVFLHARGPVAVPFRLCCVLTLLRLRSGPAAADSPEVAGAGCVVLRGRVAALVGPAEDPPS